MYKKRKGGKKEGGSGRERERKKRRLKSWQTLSLTLAKDREALISLALAFFHFSRDTWPHAQQAIAGDGIRSLVDIQGVSKKTRDFEISPAITNVSSGGEKRWKIRNIIFVENIFLRNVSLILDRSLKLIFLIKI